MGNNLCVAHNPYPSCPNCEIEKLQSQLSQKQAEVDTALEIANSNHESFLKVCDEHEALRTENERLKKEVDILNAGPRLQPQVSGLQLIAENEVLQDKLLGLQVLVERMRGALKDWDCPACENSPFANIPTGRRCGYCKSLVEALSQSSSEGLGEVVKELVVAARNFVDSFGLDWFKEHQKEDHCVTLDHKDENEIADHGIAIIDALHKFDKAVRG